MTIKYTKYVYDKLGTEYHNYRLNSSENFWNKHIEIPAMKSILKNMVKNKKVLDLGCGSGIFTKMLKEWGSNIIGLDLSKTMIDIARNENPEIKFYVGNAGNTPFVDLRFDIVSSSLVAHYFKNLNPLFREVRRILKNNGYFVFSIQHPIDGAVKKIKFRGSSEFLLTSYFNNNKNRYTFTKYVKRMEGVKIMTYHHTFEAIFYALHKNGFLVEDLLEPKPKRHSKKINPVRYDITIKIPSFCIIKAKKFKI